MKRYVTQLLLFFFMLITSIDLLGQCSVDAFGIIKFYPTKAGTREWTSEHWNNGVDRTIKYASDTYDPTDWTEDHSGSTNGFHINGTGVMNMSGGSPRFHINSLRTNKVAAQQFLNTELTAYYRRIGTTGPDYGGMVVGARSGPLGHASSGGNDCDATTYYSRIRHDGKWDFEKELKHPTSDYWSGSGFHKQDPLWHGSRLPENRWIGMKYIIYNIENDTKVKMEMYIDSTSNGNPVNGGHWEKVGEVTDDGNWPAAPSAITGCTYTDPKTIILQGHGTFVLRTDGDQAEYKMVSIREIDVTQTPNYVCTTANTLPTVTISSPATNTVYTAPAASITLAATASDADGSISKVDFYNGNTLLNTDNATPFSYNWTSVAAGTYTITAKATDDKSGETTSSAITIIVNQVPTVSITSPTNNANFVAPATITLNATASDADGTISKVEFYNGTTLLNTDNSTPYSYNWASLGVGTYSITAKATDNNGGVSNSAAINISVNANQPSVVSVTSPSANAIISGTLTITVTATDPDGSITKVEFFDGATLLGSSTTAPYNFTWNNPSSGSHSISAKVTDSNGGVTTSSSVSFTSQTATGILSSGNGFANVFPNPSHETFIIKFNQEIKHLWITNMYSELVEEMHDINQNAQIEIGKDLSDGTYVLMIQSASDKVEVVKLVKVK